MTLIRYPTAWTPGPVYTYSFDAMSRLAGMTDQNQNAVVSNVTYNATNQLLTLNYFGGGETRQYNSLGQMTQLNVSNSYYTYTYPSGTNNGKIRSTYESLSGETISYTYDSLNRLLTAAGSSTGGNWGETYGYDSFGNLTSKTPTAGAPPTLSQAPNPANNLVGQSYDANGNQMSAPGFYGALLYDAENRMVGAPGVQYAYDSRNQRIWTGILDSSNNLTGQTVNFYGVDGQMLGSYPLTVVNPGFADSPASLAAYFGGKRVTNNAQSNPAPYLQDRLGSNRTSGWRYYPWGEDHTTLQPNDQVKFATYTRDSATLLDYADQRYYSSIQGRFMTPDPTWRSASLENPQSWNRYAYVNGDPVNGNDPLGLCTAMLAGITQGPGGSQAFDNEQATLGAIAGFAYSGQSQVSSVASVASQALFGPNTSTAVAVAALEEALAQNSGSIDIVAYSGGAQAFTTAFDELTAAQQARIGNILYISPGAGGQLAGTANAANTTVVLGAGAADIAATFAMTIPLGANQIETNCSHTDLACLFAAAQPQLSQFANDGPCKNQDIFFLHTQAPPTPGPRALPFLPLNYGGGGDFFGGGGGSPVPDPVPTPVVTSTVTYNGP